MREPVLSTQEEPVKRQKESLEDSPEANKHTELSEPQEVDSQKKVKVVMFPFIGETNSTTAQQTSDAPKYQKHLKKKHHHQQPGTKPAVSTVYNFESVDKSDTADNDITMMGEVPYTKSNVHRHAICFFFSLICKGFASIC